mgnify:CR=1 FL=1
MEKRERNYKRMGEIMKSLKGFQDVLPLCMLAEAGIDPEEGDFECAVKDGTLVLRSDADTNVYEMMKSLDDDFRDLLKGAGVSLSGLFLLLKEELDHDE